jgi:hypothetical protein
MLRKLAIAAATSAALALSLVPSGASARGFGGHVGVGHVGVGHVGGWGHPGFGRFGFHRFGYGRFHRFGFRRGPFFAGVYPWVGTCWRLVPGPFGWHRISVCGPYRYWW